MNLLNIYYRAFKEYRKETKDKRICQIDRKAMKKAGLEFDKLETIKYLCTIEEDWVKAIEDGLVFVDKAVREERQFILTNGEVVPIEKAKKISKYSIEHLARHSDLISRVPENENDTLVPDKIYIVEKLSDYAVYENRFLYMLLCYLRDFIDFRLEKINELRMTYKADMYLRKEIETKTRTFMFEVSLNEKRIDNPYPLPNDDSNKIIERIKSCQYFVSSLLNTQIMQDVSKAPMVKPPIVKTNVLKMNNNFKGALALYDFVSTYSKVGYESEEVIQQYHPFDNNIADELAEVILLTSFLTYEHGNDLEELLEITYLEEENKRQKEEAKKLDEQIQRLKKRLSEENIGFEEYILLLEKRNKMLVKDSENLILANQEIISLNNQIELLNLEQQELNRQIKKLEEIIEEKILEINNLNRKYIEDMDAIKKVHVKNILKLENDHSHRMQKLENEYEDKISQINENHIIEINKLSDEHQSEIYDLKLIHEDAMNALKEEYILERKNLSDNLTSQIDLLNDNIKKITLDNENQINQINEINNEISDYNKRILHEKNIFLGELIVLRDKSGQINDPSDFTSKERFNELEEIFNEFNKFFKLKWKDTKKSIRKQILWTKEEKKEKKHKE